MRLSALLLAALLAAPASQAAPPRSSSTGDSRDGALVGERALPRSGRGFNVLPATVKRGYRYGTDRLVHAIEKLGSALEDAHPGFTLGVGNLSRRGGGDIPQSRSHNSGRDMDLAFPMRDRRDRPVRLRHLARVEGDLRTSDDSLQLAADVAWFMVASLLEDPGIEVAWIFCSDPVRAAILDAGAEASSSAELIAHARIVLRQPSDSSPHDDHFHVRVYCSPRETAEHDCHDRAPGWPWWAHRTIQGAELLAPEERIEREKKIREALEGAGHGAILELEWRLQIEKLIGLLRDEPDLREAVAQRLEALTGNAMPGSRSASGAEHRRWTRWWESNRSRYGVSDAPR